MLPKCHMAPLMVGIQAVESRAVKERAERQAVVVAVEAVPFGTPIAAVAAAAKEAVVAVAVKVVSVVTTVGHLLVYSCRMCR